MFVYRAKRIVWRWDSFGFGNLRSRRRQDEETFEKERGRLKTLKGLVDKAIRAVDSFVLLR